MPNPVPSQLSLTNIADGSSITAAPHRNNYAAIQAAVNEIIAALSNGTSGQFLQAVDGSDVQWGNAADKSSASTQDFTGSVYAGATAGLPTTLTGSGVLTTGEFSAVTSATSATGLALSVANNVDTQPRILVQGDGTVRWGPGSAGQDSTLYRKAAGTLGINGALLADGTGASQGIGYGTGSGGTATEAAGAVTLNKICGAITVSNNALTVGGPPYSFTLTNSQIAATDVVVISSGLANNAFATVTPNGAGSVIIQCWALRSGGSSGGTINFAVVKAANA